MKPMGQGWLYLQNPLALLFLDARSSGADNALAMLDTWFELEPHPPQTKERIAELLLEAAKDPFPPAKRPGSPSTFARAMSALLGRNRSR